MGMTISRLKPHLLLPAVLLLASCGDSPEELYRDANTAYAAHDFSAARAKVIAALKEQPDKADYILLQVRTLIALGDGEGAKTALDRLARFRKISPEVQALTAETALLRKHPQDALNVLGDEESVEAERLRALAYLQLEDPDKAQRHFARSVDLGGSARTFADFAQLRMTNGDAAGASEMLIRAQKADPDAIDTLLVTGEFAQKSGDLKTALDAYQQAGKLYPDSFAARLGEVAVLGDLGRLDEMDKRIGVLSSKGVKGLEIVWLKARSAAARKDWAKVRDLVQPDDTTIPANHPLRIIYAQALLELGAAHQAISQIQGIARSQPNNREAVRILAAAQLAGGDARAAFDTMKPVAENLFARPEERSLMARIAKEAGDPSAQKYEAMAKSPAPRALAADFLEANAAIKANDWQRAVTAYRRVLAVTDGKNVIVLNNLANALLELGDGQEARDYATRAYRLAPDNPSIIDTYAWVVFRTGGDKANAGSLLRKAAEKAPSNQTIKDHLAAVQSATG